MTKMRVHRIGTVPVTTTVMHEGEATPVIMPMLEVELTDDTGQHGSWLLRFKRRVEIDAAKQKYQQDAQIEFPVL